MMAKPSVAYMYIYIVCIKLFNSPSLIKWEEVLYEDYRIHHTHARNMRLQYSSRRI